MVVMLSSVTRELGSPAALILDSASRARRSSSRASRRATREPEAFASNLSQSSYSLPPTPLTATFDESVPSAKRRRTQERELPSKEVTEPSSQAAAPGSVQTPNEASSSRLTRSRRSSIQLAGDVSSKVVEREKSATQAATTATDHTQTTLHTFLLKNPQKRKTLSENSQSETSESMKDSSSTPANMDSNDAALSRSRQARKSIPAKLSTPGPQEKHTGQSTAPSSPVSTSRSSRAKSRSAVASTRSKSHPLASASPAAVRAANSQGKQQLSTKPSTPTPLNPSRLSTPGNSTIRSGRTDRKSTAAIENADQQTPRPLTRGAEKHKSPAVTTAATTSQSQKADESSRAQRSTAKPRPSNTVTLTIGRKSLESVIGESSLNKLPYDHEIADSVEATPLHVYNDSFHFDYDTEMYKNNYGLDGQVDAPTSPTSFSTTTSAAARTSGRTRKPTIRALESIESEKRFRRTRGASVKVEQQQPATTINEASSSGAKMVQPKQQITGLKSTTSAPQVLPRLDLAALGKQMFELAAVAVTDDYTPADEAGQWWEEMRHEWKRNRAEKEKEAQASQQLAKEGRVGEDEGGESRLTSNNPFILDIVPGWNSRTDADGWMFTGQTNQHGEEYVFVSPEFEWYRPNNTYGDEQLPQPPVRLRSQDQAEKDRVFGFPPRIGERNLPREVQGSFLFEDINQERAKIRAREAARVRGLPAHRSMSLNDMETLIFQYDNTGSVPPPTAIDATPKEQAAGKTRPSREVPSRKRRRADTTTTNTNTMTPKAEDLIETMSTQKPKRRRHDVSRTATPSTSMTTKETPASQKPSLKIKLTFSKGSVIATTAGGDTATENSRKRSHAEIEDSSIPGDHHDTRSAKAPKVSTNTERNRGSHTLNRPASVPSTPQPAAATASKTDLTNIHTPGSTADSVLGDTPGGRPRRRAAAALMAGFQHRADERAHRASARKKVAFGTEKPDQSTPKKAEEATTTNQTNKN